MIKKNNEKIKLRELKTDDAKGMLEWMHDSDIQMGLQKGFMNYTLEDALKFIKSANIPDEICGGTSIHYAISGEDDEYLGTISLKNIDTNNNNAEFAIVTRKKVQGKGVATAAIGLVLKKAFYEFNLHRVYLSVLSDNTRAIKVYERCGFECEGTLREHIFKNGKYIDWKMYGVLRENYDKRMDK